MRCKSFKLAMPCLGILPMLVWLAVAECSRASDISGRYVVASLPAKTGSLLSEATYGGIADITSRRNAYTMAWHLTAETRRLRGIALLDDGNLLGVSLATGGIAYGVAIYRHNASEHRWRGQWITSIDAGGTPGEISFDDEGSTSPLGRHHLHCMRPGAGGFDGTVTITAEGTDFRLAFAAEGAALYRGAGILTDDGRLVVGWSFGSAPAVAVYRANADGLLTGRRLSLRGAQATVNVETLARSGDDAARLLPAAARIDPALVPPDVDAGMEPDAPEVKTWVYEELMDRYNADGWAERWLEGQLTPEEYAWLQRAVHRRRGRDAQSHATTRATIGDLIEQERRRNEE